jgi:hypothetical protein
MRKYEKKQILEPQKLGSPYYNLPVHTRDTAVRVRGMPRCAEIHYRTRTRTTRFGKTAGIPVPVPNPTLR